jgi:hypothetical protein
MVCSAVMCGGGAALRPPRSFGAHPAGARAVQRAAVKSATRAIGCVYGRTAPKLRGGPGRPTAASEFWGAPCGCKSGSADGGKVRCADYRLCLWAHGPKTPGGPGGTRPPGTKSPGRGVTGQSPVEGGSRRLPWRKTRSGWSAGGDCPLLPVLAAGFGTDAVKFAPKKT